MESIKSYGLIVLFLSVWACGSSAVSQEIRTVTYQEVKELLGTNIQVVDVRTPEEVYFGMLPGAVHIDFYAPDFKEQLANLDKETPVVIYCAVGGRSGSAVPVFKELGFTTILDYAGGYRDWQNKHP